MSAATASGRTSTWRAGSAPARRDAARQPQPAAREADRFCHRPARPRRALRDRRLEDPPPAGAWRPRHTFDAGLRDTVRWFLDHKVWWERIMSGAYRGERLGLPGWLGNLARGRKRQSDTRQLPCRYAMDAAREVPMRVPSSGQPGDGFADHGGRLHCRPVGVADPAGADPGRRDRPRGVVAFGRSSWRSAALLAAAVLLGFAAIEAARRPSFRRRSIAPSSRSTTRRSDHRRTALVIGYGPARPCASTRDTATRRCSSGPARSNRRAHGPRSAR